MSALLDALEVGAPIVTELRLGMGPAEAAVLLPKIRGRDVDVFLDGERLHGVRSVRLSADTVGSIGALTGRTKHAAWRARAGTVGSLELVINDPETGRELARIPRRVKLGVAVDVGEKDFELSLEAVAT